jgi:hypothetical protein
MEEAQMEREQNIFAIIKTMEFLEIAYMNGKVPGEKYDAEWRSLFHQFQTCTNVIQNFEGIDSFIQRMNL